MEAVLTAPPDGRAPTDETGGWTTAALLDEALVAPRRAIVPMDDTQIDERLGWYRILTPSLRHGGLNEVAECVIAESGADRVIDDTLALYRAHGVRFRWTVAPGSAPADLRERLLRRGLTETRSRAMWRSTASRASSVGEAHASSPLLATAATTASTGLVGRTVIEVSRVDLTTLPTFTRVLSEGWSMDPAPIATLHERCLGHRDGRWHFFLASIDGVPAGAAGYAALERSAYLVGGVVLPGVRGRGLYRALVDARMDHARARGLGIATSVARELTSAPALERLGFETIALFSSFSNAGE